MNKYLFKDDRGKPSVTTTAFMIGFAVVCAKLLFSGVTVYGVVLSEFSGVDFGAAVAALGGIYVLRANAKNSSCKCEKGDAK